MHLCHFIHSPGKPGVILSSMVLLIIHDYNSEIETSRLNIET